MVEKAETVQGHFTLLGGEGLKAPKKSSWMKSLHGVLIHGGLWIRVYGLPEFASGPPPRGGFDENSARP